MRRGADRRGMDPVPGRVLSGGNRLHRVRHPGGLPLSVGDDSPRRRYPRVLGDGGVRRYHPAGLALRVSGRNAGMEVKPPVPQVPPPGWTEIKDLQEWEKYD